MNKKILTTLLSVFMFLIIMPTRIFAENNIAVTKSDGNSASEGTYESQDVAGGDFAWSDQFLYIKGDDLVISGIDNEGCQIIILPGVNKITFKDLYILNHIDIHYDTNEFTIVLKGNNQIGQEVVYSQSTTKDSYSCVKAISTERDLYIDGDGSLVIYDSIEGIENSSENNPKLEFKNTFTGTISIEDAGNDTEPESLPPCAISIGNGTVTINGGTLKLTSYNKNAITAKNIIINGGEVIAKGEMKAMSAVPTLSENIFTALASTNFDGTDSTAYDSSYIEEYKYIHFKNATVADVLPESFPKTETSGWVNENGKKIYVDNNILHCSFNVPLESSLQKDGNNYKYVGGNNQECVFVMESGVLKSIRVSGSLFITSFDGEYVPYKSNDNSDLKPVISSGYKAPITGVE